MGKKSKKTVSHNQATVASAAEDSAPRRPSPPRAAAPQTQANVDPDTIDAGDAATHQPHLPVSEWDVNPSGVPQDDVRTREPAAMSPTVPGLGTFSPAEHRAWARASALQQTDALPTTQFTSWLAASGLTLDVRGCGLTAADMPALLEALCSHPELATVALAGNRLGDLSPLAPAVAALSALIELDWSDTQASDASVAALAHSLVARASGLRHLALRGCEWFPHGAAAWASAVHALSLRSLDLSRPCAAAEGSSVLGPVVAALAAGGCTMTLTLSTLRLAEAGLTDRDAASLALLLTTCRSLALLDLSGNRLSPVGCAQIGTLLLPMFFFSCFCRLARWGPLPILPLVACAS